MNSVHVQHGSRPALHASLVLHGALLLWLLHSPRPIFVAPSSVLRGMGGATVTHLYWPAQHEGSDSHAANLPERDPASRSEPKLQFPKQATQTLAANQELTQPLTASDSSAAQGASARSAGSPFGSLSEGPESGHDIRPALPVATFEPVLASAALTDVAEGNCVVEITIDESGAVVAQSVVQSMGAAIDEAVLAAVSHWRFQPATRDGVPIPSKQDVVYHFKPRS